MLDSIPGFGLVAMLLVAPSKPNIGFLLLRIEGHGLLETLDSLGDVSTKHLRGHQLLPAEAGPHPRILVIDGHGLGIFLFDFSAELYPPPLPLPQPTLPSLTLR